MDVFKQTGSSHEFTFRTLYPKATTAPINAASKDKEKKCLGYINDWKPWMLETSLGLVIWGMFVVVTLSDILIPLRDGFCVSSCEKIAFQQEPIWFSLVIAKRTIILLFVVVLYALIIDDVLIR